MFISVDLPAPFSPSSACTSPALEIEVDRVVREHPGKPLRDSAQLQDRALCTHVRAILDGLAHRDVSKVGRRARRPTFGRSDRYLTVAGMPLIFPALSSAYCASTFARMEAGTFELHLP